MDICTIYEWGKNRRITLHPRSQYIAFCGVYTSFKYSPCIGGIPAESNFKLLEEHVHSSKERLRKRIVNELMHCDDEGKCMNIE